MRSGQWIYRDFFQFNAPGIDYVYFFAFKIFGIRTWVPNLVTLLLGTSLAWITLHLSRQLMPRRWAALTTAIFVVFIYGRWLDATHHWVSLFAIFLAIRVLIPHRSPSRLAIAGALIGFAAFFTQPAGAAAWLAFAVSLFYEHTPADSRHTMLRKQASLLASTLLIWSLLSAPTLLHVGWRTLWYFQVIFPQRYELRVDDNPIGVFLHALPHRVSALQAENLIFYLLLIATTPITLCVLWKKRFREKESLRAHRMPLVLLASAGLLIMAEVVSRPTWIRLYASLLPSLIVFFAVLAWLLRTKPRLNLLILIALWSAVILSALRQTTLNHRTFSSIATLPAGKLALQPQDAEEFRAIAARTHPGELFFQAFGVHLYLPLELSSPVYMDYLRQSPVTRPEFLLNAIHALETNRVRYIVLRPALDVTFHANPAESHHLDALYFWIEAHYTPVQRFSNKDELWELQP